MRLFGADWGLLTNGKRYFIYRTNGEGDETLVESVSIDDLPSSAQIQNLTRQNASTESAAPDRADEEIPQISDDTKQKIIEFSTRKHSSHQQSHQENTFGPPYDSLIESIAPSVQGDETEKLGILLSLFGGVRKHVENEQTIRGAIHVLIVHDSGTPTADVARSAAQLASQAVYLSGKTSAEELLTTKTDAHISLPSELSDYAVETLARASHAVVTRFNEINEDEFKHLQEAFATELPFGDSDSRKEMQEMTGLVATSRPQYGRFDEYEPIAEQIDLEPALISQFDLIFSVTDKPDQENDTRLAEHILQTNYAGELKTHQEQLEATNASTEQVEQATEEATPTLDAEFLRKYIAFAKRSCFPTMTEETKEVIRDFYTNVRAKAESEDNPVPVTARKLEALVRLAESSARVRLSDTVEVEDAERVINVFHSSLQDMGVDPEAGQYDADAVETGTSKSQRDRIKNIKRLIADVEDDHEWGAPVDEVLERVEDIGIEPSKAEHEIKKLKQQGELYEPSSNHLRTY